MKKNSAAFWLLFCVCMEHKTQTFTYKDFCERDIRRFLTELEQLGPSTRAVHRMEAFFRYVATQHPQYLSTLKNKMKERINRAFNAEEQTDGI